MTIRAPFHLIPRLAAIVGLLMIAGCVQPAVVLGPPQAAVPARLSPGDRLRVIVFGQNQLSGDFIIADDGTISLPLVGRVPLAGMTPAEAEANIRTRLAHGIVKEPVVNIDVVTYQPVYVVGEVARPGGYQASGRLNVISAVALAGGYTYRARRDAIGVLRAGDPNQLVPVTDNTPVGPGDVVVVPERWF